MTCNLQWRHNERDCVSNHRRLDCLPNRFSRVDQRNHQSSASLAFVRGIHQWPVNSPHKGPVTRKMFPFDDVIMANRGPCRWFWGRTYRLWMIKCRDQQTCIVTLQLQTRAWFNILHKIPYNKISQNFEGTRSSFRNVQSLWNSAC